MKIRYESKNVPGEFDIILYRARVLASPSRLDVWSCIGEVGMYPTDVASTLGLSPATVSHHLAILEHAGLVRHVRQGRHRLYLWTGERWGVVSAAELEQGQVA